MRGNAEARRDDVEGLLRCGRVAVRCTVRACREADACDPCVGWRPDTGRVVPLDPGWGRFPPARDVPDGAEPEPVGFDPEEVDPAGGELGGSVTVVVGPMAGVVPVTPPRTVPTVVPRPDTTCTMPPSGFAAPPVPDDAAAAVGDAAEPVAALAAGTTGVVASATTGALRLRIAVASPASAAMLVQRIAAVGMPDVLVGMLDTSEPRYVVPEDRSPEDHRARDETLASREVLRHSNGAGVAEPRQPVR